MVAASAKQAFIQCDHCREEIIGDLVKKGEKFIAVRLVPLKQRSGTSIGIDLYTAMTKTSGRLKRIGVLALQGAFVEHIALLRRLDVETLPIRLARELNGFDGLIIPGGESTTIGRLMREYDLMEPLRKLAKEALPIMGTCAGMVLLAKQVSDINVEPLGVMDIDVRRNAFGRQVDSFEVDLEIPAIGGPPFHAVFIRAPFIASAGDGVEVLSRLPDGTGVAARQRNMLALAFHPELTDDPRLHDYFLSMIRIER